MYKVINIPLFLVWWGHIRYVSFYVKNCEIMAKLVCNASLLKDNRLNDYHLKKLPFTHKVYTECFLGIREDVNHIILKFS